MFFCSCSGRRPIILEKLGDIGYSSFADIKMLIVASSHILSLAKFFQPMECKYLSKMEQATKRLSGLYPFFSWR